VAAAFLTGLEALDVARALLCTRFRERETRISWIDVKLGVRMLAKHPGLTMVGVVAISFGITVGSVVFQLMTDLYRPRLGLDESDRIVELEEAHQLGSEMHRVLHDFLVWRAELETVDDVSAYRTVSRNLTVQGAETTVVSAAQISASAFRLARVPPLHGRTLVESDEVLDGPSVVVIGYDVWQGRFEGDPDAIGRTVRLGVAATTVVGVMPAGFRFPWDHDVWTPLRVDPLAYARGEGPTLSVFGRLAPGASLGQAQAELTTLGRALAEDFPETNAALRTFVRPYRGGFISGPELLLRTAYSGVIVLPLLLLALLCANVALMVFARTAARENEIVVRSALGASRGRVVTQIFVEALVLASVGAGLGLLAGHLGLGLLVDLMEAEDWANDVPFWIHRGLTGATVLYAGLFTVVGALVVGVVPALKVTASGLRARLQSATAGGGGLRMGGLWTGVIVTQVAVTVALIPFVVAPLVVGFLATRQEASLPTEEYLTAWLETDRESIAVTSLEEASVSLERVGDAPRGIQALVVHQARERLKELLLAEPDVESVALMNRLPGSSRLRRRTELDSDVPPGFAGIVSVDPDYFDLVGARIVRGRDFEMDDLSADEDVVVVNEAFVRSVVDGAGAVGQRLRYPVVFRNGGMAPAQQDEAPWYRIVGVVDDESTRVGFDAFESAAGDGALIYHPLAPGSAYPVAVVVRTSGDPLAVAPRLRRMARDIDATLRLGTPVRMDEVVAATMRPLRTGLVALFLTGALALLLSNAGIYSAMAFTVSRRTREIGVRVALGAGRRRIVTAILGHSMLRVALGVLCGAVLLLGIGMVISEGQLFRWVAAGGRTPRIVAGALGYLALMIGFCALACVVPTRRALAIEPTEALRAEG
jgi:predicted permease